MASGQVSYAAVLVVDDEFLIRTDLAACLEEAGFLVLEATNADEAMTILEARADIQLVFTDIDMPGSMDGLKLAAAVRNRWPPIKIIVASGHVIAEASDVPEGGRFLSKPHERRAVARAVREMIGV
jgi:two-component system, response regulator PdtaR